MKKYYYYKEKARQLAIEWQTYFSKTNYSWNELNEFSQEFAKLGKRFGLLREFKTNGII